MMTRRILHSISETPREKLIENITNYRRRDAKALAVCFNDVEDCRYDIVGIITERLHCGDMFKDERTIGGYHLPTTNYANVDNFIDSNYSIPGDAMKPQQTLKYPTSMSDNANPDIDVNIDTDADFGADVM